jgi:peptidylprolyl isomerase
MSTLARIDEETISAEDFLKYLKLSNQFPHLMERMIRRRLMVHAARRRKIEASLEEIQQAADDFRRCMGLHRALDARRWMSAAGLTPDDLEDFVAEHVLLGKLVSILTAPENIESYFERNAPRFESADLSHIVLEDEAAAREVAAMVREEPENFGRLAREYSLDAETRADGGRIPEVRRGSLPIEIEERVFSAVDGEILGPFPLHDSDVFEIIRVNRRGSAVLDEENRERIAEMIQEEWLAEQIKEHAVECAPESPAEADELQAANER